MLVTRVKEACPEKTNSISTNIVHHRTKFGITVQQLLSKASCFLQTTYGDISDAEYRQVLTMIVNV